MTQAPDAGEPAAPDEGAVERFWGLACHRGKLTTLPGYLPSSTLEAVTPPTWSFGRTPAQADELVQLVVDGTKTATASARADYDAEDAPLPRVGEMGIVLDGAGHPRALVETTAVEVVPFSEVGDEHARDEGEGDRTLAHWRQVHAAFFAGSAGGFEPDMPVVLERFRLVFGQ
ncbi:hypothetical protein ENKNEFLB_02484 [Nocardioides aquaticus]|uniref:ASCH domain-containing protein n=1 Tax=Nocardioides aquaticus TaxID=160826 RepID=A0ABX8ELY9_9ACTN|nr:ASCH domain-containing protein [Nocardioides aquaticus]QVT80093.1 hypothetical protein ENKNEFLB_02484 [Nocardioides aquaticus]